MIDRLSSFKRWSTMRYNKSLSMLQERNTKYWKEEYDRWQIVRQAIKEWELRREADER